MTTNNTQNGLTFAQLNDTQKQRLVDKFLEANPLRLQNTLVEYVLQKSYEDMEAPFSHDDITNNEPTANIAISSGWVDLTESERDTMLEELQEKLEELENYEEVEEWGQLTNDIQELGDADFESYPEIYQWFSCTDWLIRSLEEKGECTLDNEFWGRQCCGQSVVLDNVMQEIAFDWFVAYKETSLTWEQIIELGI